FQLERRKLDAISGLKLIQEELKLRRSRRRRRLAIGVVVLISAIGVAVIVVGLARPLLLILPLLLRLRLGVCFVRGERFSLLARVFRGAVRRLLLHFSSATHFLNLLYNLGGKLGFRVLN
ncbi:hypothetical protein TorRG33x02_087090, partial [Trema orientale]